MNKELEQLKKDFIVEDMAQYWKDKMLSFEFIMRDWFEKGVTVSVMGRQVVEIYGADELDTKQKHEVASATEGFLYAEGQYECANDALLGADE